MTRNWRTILVPISLSVLLALAISRSTAIEAGEIGQEASANASATSTALSWTTSSTPLPKPLNEFGAAVWDDRIYVTGGNSGSYATISSDVYFSEVDADGTLSAWTPTTSLPGVQNNNELVAVNSMLYMIGEGTSTDNVKRATILADGSLGSQWTAAAGGYMSHGRIRTAAVSHGDDIYVLGGWTGSSPLDKVARARTNPDGSYVSPGWQGERPLPHALHAHAAAVLNGYLYVLGGVRDLSSDVRADVIAAEIMTDGSLGPWNTVTSLPIPMYSMEAVAFQGKLYVIGGSVAIDSHLDTVYAATPLNDGSGGLSSWQAMESLPTARTGHKVVATSSAVASLGGHTSDAIFVAKSPMVNGMTTRVSVDSAGAQGNDRSYHPAISADGRFVAFHSGASNLVHGDTNGSVDVFVHDRQTGATKRVSVDSEGAQGNNPSYHPAISADGRFVAFESHSTNLVSGDSNNREDVFVHDRQTGATTRVSVDSAGAQVNDHSYYPAISADGRFVSFDSEASNLVPGDTNGRTDVFVHDRQTGATTRVSVDSAGAQGNERSYDSAISDDGRFIAFSSYASNLVPGDTNVSSDVFVHDRQTGATTRASVDSAGTQGNGPSYYPAVSADGRFVAFESGASTLVPGDTFGFKDVFVHDRQTGATTRVSVDSTGAQGSSDTSQPTISADGRLVAFRSYATNLVPGDTNGFHDVFVHDRQTEATTRVSVGSGGAQGNEHSYDPAISADGRLVAFVSRASTLVPSDTNALDDVFVHDRGAASGSVLGASTVAPFLRLPINYSGEAKQALQDTDKVGGRIDSWFDHTYPDRSLGNEFTLYSGEAFTKTVGSCYRPISTSSGVSQYCYDGHGGLDFSRSGSDEPVKAAAAGTVVDIYTTCTIGGVGCDESDGFGNYVLLYHHQGYFTRYSHLESVSVPDPDNQLVPREQLNVEAGVQVGVMGKTGTTTGTNLDDGTGVHLDFMVYADVNGDQSFQPSIDRQVDPFGFFANGEPAPEVDPWVTDRGGARSYPLWLDLSAAGSSFRGDEGGQITTLDGDLSCEVPPGFFQNAVVSINLNNNPPPGGVSGVFRRAGRWFWLKLTEFTPLGSRSANAPTEVSASDPMTLMVDYSDISLKHLDEDALHLSRWDESQGSWLALPTIIDNVSKTLTAETMELGAFDVQAPLICPADSTEPDDNDKSAIELNLGVESVERLFDSEQDVDWFEFELVEGSHYGLVINGDDSVSATVELRDATGETVLASGTNQLSWMAQADGMHKLRVVPAIDSITGCTAEYTALLTEGASSSADLTFRSGWNMVSLHLTPDDPAMDAIFPLPQRDNLVLCKHDNDVYWPEFNINTIRDWDPAVGYQCYTTSPITLTIIGLPIDPTTPMPLEAGWSTFAYWRHSEMPIDQALASLGSAVVLVKNNDGEIYWPEFGINTIGNMQRGQGYKMYLQAAATLEYPSN